MHAERVPELPPIPLAEKIEQLQNVPSFMGYAVLVVADENSHEFVALAEIAIPKTEENQHLAQFMIQVLPAYRCKGYGHISPNRPQQLSQGDTGVFPAYRGRGLGHRTVCGKSRRSWSVGCGKGE